MNKYNELKSVIKNYESETFYGADLTDEQATIIADKLIEDLINNDLNGVTLSDIYSDYFEDDSDD